jgi:uncharacterized protein YcbX
MSATIARICRYPVKGLNAEDLDRVELEPGLGLPHDRRFALAHAAAMFDPAAPDWLPKSNFLMLMKNERLAALEAIFDDPTGTLTIQRDGKQVSRGKVTEPLGRAMIGKFFAAYMKDECPGKPRLVEGPDGYMFSDTPARVLSVINLASVRDLERVVGKPVDPLRFRANLYIEGAYPWEEFHWIGEQITGGATTFTVEGRIDRCAATNVDPVSAARDLNIPKDLRRGYGHVNMGVYVAVTRGGSVAVGDAVKTPN